MRILMLAWEYPPKLVGGLAKVVYDLSHKFVFSNNKFSFVCCNLIFFLELSFILLNVTFQRSTHIHSLFNQYLLNVDCMPAPLS